MTTDALKEDRKGDCSPLPANVVMASPIVGLQDVHQTSIQATEKRAKTKMVTGSLKGPSQADTPENENLQRMDDHQESAQGTNDSKLRQKIAIICAIIGIIGVLLTSNGLCIGGGILIRKKSSDTKESAKEHIAYQGDTPLLAEVNEEYHKVTVQQLCSGGGGHTVELYVASNCDLEPHCFNVSSGVTTVNSTRNPTVSVVDFNGQSHIYMTSDSSITFSVDISTPMANTSLVIFDNYTYFTDFEHSDHPSTTNALLVHSFKGQGSSYIFRGETNTYFLVFESLKGVNFTFWYSGYICNYSHLDYKKSQCDLPASTCQQKSCPFEYQPNSNKTCILGYVPQSVTLPTFANLWVETYRRDTATNYSTTLLVVGVALLVISMTVCTYILWSNMTICTCVILWPLLLYTCRNRRSGNYEPIPS